MIPSIDPIQPQFNKLSGYPQLPASLLQAIIEKNADSITSKIIKELRERL